MGLREHFQDIWNFFDVIIFTLAAIMVPIWVDIIFIHFNTFTTNAAQNANRQEFGQIFQMKKTEAELAADEEAFFKTDFAENLIAAS